MDASEILRRLTYYHPGAEKADTYVYLRSAYVDLAMILNNNTPDGREKSLALTKLEESLMWANAAVARPPEG